MEVQRTRVDGGVLVVMLRLTINLTALSLEEQLSKRKRLVTQMCDALRDELRYDHQNDAAWEALAVLRRGTDGWCGHEASFSTLDVHLNAASGHDAIYYDLDPHRSTPVQLVAKLERVFEYERLGRDIWDDDNNSWRLSELSYVDLHLEMELLCENLSYENDLACD